jgi:drug/metabolite transporter (DMT)-like permease
VAGFAGVLLMVRPGGAHGLSLPAIAMLGASFLFSLTVTGLKTLTRDHAPSTLLYWGAALGFVLAIPGAVVQWRWPSLTDFGLLCAMGAIATVNQACYIKGLQWGDAAAMAPMDYTRLIFAAGAGFLLFDEVPSVMTLAGAAVVVASTLYITWRERIAARAVS